MKIIAEIAFDNKKTKKESADCYVNYANNILIPFFSQVHSSNRSFDTDKVVLHLMLYLVNHYEKFKNELSYQEKVKLLFGLCRTVSFLTNTELYDSAEVGLINRYEITEGDYIGHNIFKDLKFLQKVVVYDSPKQNSPAFYGDIFNASNGSKEREMLEAIWKDVSSSFKKILTFELGEGELSLDSKQITNYQNIFTVASYYREQQRTLNAIEYLRTCLEFLSTEQESKYSEEQKLFLILRTIEIVGEVCSTRIMTPFTKKILGSEIAQRLISAADSIVKLGIDIHSLNVESVHSLWSKSKKLETGLENISGIFKELLENLEAFASYDQVIEYYNPLSAKQSGTVERVGVSEFLLAVTDFISEIIKLDSTHDARSDELIIQSLEKFEKFLQSNGIEVTKIEDDNPLRFQYRYIKIIEQNSKNILRISLEVIDGKTKAKKGVDVSIVIPQDKVKFVELAIDSITNHNIHLKSNELVIPKKFLGVMQNFIISTEIAEQKVLGLQSPEFIDYFINLGKVASLWDFLHNKYSKLITEFYMQTICDGLKQLDKVQNSEIYKVLGNVLVHFEDNLDVDATGTDIAHMYSYHISQMMVDLEDYRLPRIEFSDGTQIRENHIKLLQKTEYSRDFWEGKFANLGQDTLNKILYYAVAHNNENAVDVLLEKGADGFGYVLDVDGLSAFVKAIANHEESIIFKLLHARVSELQTDYRILAEDIESKNIHNALKHLYQHLQKDTDDDTSSTDSSENFNADFLFPTYDILTEYTDISE